MKSMKPMKLMKKSGAMRIADITDLAGCRAVVAIQEAVWGRDAEIVPASLLVSSIKRGGVLIGAWDADRMVGFVWSMPGWRDGQPTQWSHMLAVLPEQRRAGLGEDLKWAQRDRGLAAGIDLIEWTFDPLQAANAHLNIARLGCTSSEYRANAYGEMIGPLHRGTPTDRLVAEWRIREPHVQRRRDLRDGGTGVVARDATVLDAPEAISSHASGEWIAIGDTRLNLADRRVFVPIPPRFSEMQAQATESALAWRMATREAFAAYFSCGYRVVEFFLDRMSGGGRYLLALVNT
jgi:predicted GNAT superfamily acetyltransferase